jgi:hypothetical protein
MSWNPYQNKMMTTENGQTFEDKHIKCVECGYEFLFTAGEQAYFSEKKFNEPKRCHACREIKKRNQTKQE